MAEAQMDELPSAGIQEKAEKQDKDPVVEPHLLPNPNQLKVPPEKHCKNASCPDDPLPCTENFAEMPTTEDQTGPHFAAKPAYEDGPHTKMDPHTLQVAWVRDTESSSTESLSNMMRKLKIEEISQPEQEKKVLPEVPPSLTSDVSQKASDVGLSQKASDLSQKASDVFRKVSDVFRRASDVSQKAIDLSPKASDVSQKASDVSQKASDVSQKALDVSPKASDGITSPDFLLLPSITALIPRCPVLPEVDTVTNIELKVVTLEDSPWAGCSVMPHRLQARSITYLLPRPPYAPRLDTAAMPSVIQPAILGEPSLFVSHPKLMSGRSHNSLVVALAALSFANPRFLRSNPETDFRTKKSKRKRTSVFKRLKRNHELSRTPSMLSVSVSVSGSPSSKRNVFQRFTCNSRRFMCHR